MEFYLFIKSLSTVNHLERIMIQELESPSEVIHHSHNSRVDSTVLNHILNRIVNHTWISYSDCPYLVFCHACPCIGPQLLHWWCCWAFACQSSSWNYCCHWGWTSLTFLLHWHRMDEILPMSTSKAYNQADLNCLTSIFEDFHIAHKISASLLDNSSLSLPM